MTDHDGSERSRTESYSNVRDRLSRRGFLVGTAGLGAALVGGSVLAACTSGGGGGGAAGGMASGGVSALQGGTPATGGTLNVGMITLGTAENLFPGTLVPNPDVARGYALYSPLFFANDGKNLEPLMPGLALSAESNPTATEWVFKLRDGVEWHDGRTFGANDVVYNFTQLWSSTQTNSAAKFLLDLVDFDNVKAVDRLTVRIPLKKAFAALPSIFAWWNFLVLPEGATQASSAQQPIGTGPFKFQSFTPGQRSVFVRNPNYWEQGKPYVDTLVIDSSFTDNGAMLNALLGGQLDCLVSPALQQVQQQATSGQVQVLRAPSATQTYCFEMRVDQGPFADNRIRQAFKLMTDRQAMVNGALSGYGEPGNDLLGPYTSYFAADIKPEYDPDKARSLFKEAGVLGNTFDLPISNPLPGMVESGTIWAQQAEAAGVHLNLQNVQSSIYWTAAGGLRVRPLGVNVMQPTASLASQYRACVQVGAPYNDTFWGSQPGGKEKNDLIIQAEAVLDPAKAEAAWRVVQEQQVAEGGYVAWGNYPYIDFAGNNVRGLKASNALPFNCFRFQDGWKA